jgi:hypothetical protein
MSTSEPKSGGAPSARKAGAFDIRVFIAMLIGTYGIVLLIAGIIGPSAAELQKADGVNVNLWAGLGMALVAAAFLVWARLRPVVVPKDPDAAAPPDPSAAGRHEGTR